MLIFLKHPLRDLPEMHENRVAVAGSNLGEKLTPLIPASGAQTIARLPAWTGQLLSPIMHPSPSYIQKLRALIPSHVHIYIFFYAHVHNHIYPIWRLCNQHVMISVSRCRDDGICTRRYNIGCKRNEGGIKVGWATAAESPVQTAILFTISIYVDAQFRTHVFSIFALIYKFLFFSSFFLLSLDESCIANQLACSSSLIHFFSIRFVLWVSTSAMRNQISRINIKSNFDPAIMISKWHAWWIMQ